MHQTKLMISHFSMEEIWRSVAGHNGYEVSSLGAVRSIERIVQVKLSRGLQSITRTRKCKGVLLCATLGSNGYATVHLGGGNPASVHRLVAKTFVGNPNNKPVVNHKNGNKKDNRAENLEWATVSENAIHAIAHGLMPTPSVPINDGSMFRKLILCLQTGIYYDGLRDASEALGINYSSLSQRLRGHRKNKSNLIYV